VKSRAKPTPRSQQRQSHANRFSAAVKAFLSGKTGGSNPLAQLGEGGLLYATQMFEFDDLEATFGKEMGRDLFKQVKPHLERALDSLTPALSHPEWDDKLEDIGLVFSHPEMIDFWAAWQPTAGPSGPEAEWDTLKALMATVALARTSPHFDDGWSLLKGDPELFQLFTDVSTAAKQRPGARNWGTPKLIPCGSLTRQRPRLGETCRKPALEARIAMMKRLDALMPKAKIGRTLLIDASAIPAWAPQKSGRKNPKLEAVYRKNCPEAGYRAYLYGGGVKEDVTDVVDSGGAKGGGNTRAWRGYHYVAILDQATGLCLNSALIDASINEWEALGTLLNELFALWPELLPRVELMAGDSAYDHDLTCSLLEVHYGIRPVFRLHMNAKDRDLQFSRGDARKYKHDGRLICVHKEVLDYLGVDRPSRAGLTPGAPTPETAFRVRSTGCPHCGGTPSAQMRNDWSKLTAIPHHPYGRPDLYAVRAAAFSRLRNQIEGHFNRIKAGFHLGHDGAGRTRIGDRPSHEALFHLAELGMIAMALTDQLDQAPGHQRPAPVSSVLAGWQAPAVVAPPSAAPTPVPAPKPKPKPASAPEPPEADEEPELEEEEAPRAPVGFDTLFGPLRGRDRRPPPTPKE